MYLDIEKRSKYLIHTTFFAENKTEYAAHSYAAGKGRIYCNIKNAEQSSYYYILQGRWSWVRRVRNCTPKVWAMIKENVDFAGPIFGPYSMYCAPNATLLPPPLY